MNDINCIKMKIEKIIKKSMIPEDPIHSKNTLEWLIRIKPNSDIALQIAALGHDIERAIEDRKIRRSDYRNYNDFKKAHASNSANILKEIMKNCNADKGFAEEVYDLVRCHEKGGSIKGNLLREADSISFFDVNLPFYYKRNSVKETKRRIFWGLERLSDELMGIITKFKYEDKELGKLVK
ncbi:MAG: hypothetical protein DRP89_06555, partial [Candidatus Neomarinimicrobiota bacterium]